MNPDDKAYMERALALARNGLLHTSPNPMVGAVIVAPGGRIIGEGWHRQCGQAHAEVNAIKSVAARERHLLSQSTMYVTLEPCSHYGKTPPCAKLIIETGIRRVVVAAGDPNPLVSGRGIGMLRRAGIEVDTGILSSESEALNARFMTSQRLRRPRVTLKWAQSADGFIDGRDSESAPAAAISTATSTAAVHRLRAINDAIVIGSGTFIADKPHLTVRRFAGETPLRVVMDRRGRLGQLSDGWLRLDTPDIETALNYLFTAHGVTSILVEGGSTLLDSFIKANLWDEIRIEINPRIKLADKPLTTPAPTIPAITHPATATIDGNTIIMLQRRFQIEVQNMMRNLR